MAGFGVTTEVRNDDLVSEIMLVRMRKFVRDDISAVHPQLRFCNRLHCKRIANPC